MGTELYRNGKLGDSLVDALDKLVGSNKIPPELAMDVLRAYDGAIARVLEKEVTSKGSFKGKLDTYRYIDNVWTMVASDAVFRIAPHQSTSKRDEEELEAGTVKLVLVDAKVVKLPEEDEAGGSGAPAK